MALLNERRLLFVCFKMLKSDCELIIKFKIINFSLWSSFLKEYYLLILVIKNVIDMICLIYFAINTYKNTSKVVKIE